MCSLFTTGNTSHLIKVIQRKNIAYVSQLVEEETIRLVHSHITRNCPFAFDKCAYGSFWNNVPLWSWILLASYVLATAIYPCVFSCVYSLSNICIYLYFYMCKWSVYVLVLANSLALNCPLRDEWSISSWIEIEKGLPTHTNTYKYQENKY